MRSYWRNPVSNKDVARRSRAGIHNHNWIPDLLQNDGFNVGTAVPAATRDRRLTHLVGATSVAIHTPDIAAEAAPVTALHTGKVGMTITSALNAGFSPPDSRAMLLVTSGETKVVPPGGPINNLSRRGPPPPQRSRHSCFRLDYSRLAPGHAPCACCLRPSASGAGSLRVRNDGPDVERPARLLS